jgi:hypothetical protein
MKFDEPIIKIALQTLFPPKTFWKMKKIETEQSRYVLSIYRKSSENTNRTKVERILFFELPKVQFLDPELLLPRAKLGFFFGGGRETWGWEEKNSICFNTFLSYAQVKIYYYV